MSTSWVPNLLRGSGLGTTLSRRRQLYGMLVGLLGAPLLTLALLPWREDLGLDTVLLLFVLVSVAASAVGGIVPAAVASLLSFGLANFFFANPYGTLAVANRNEIFDLLAFLTVAALVGVITELGAQTRAKAERSRLEAQWLADLGGRELRPDSVPRALEDTRTLYGMHAARLIRDGETVAEIGTVQPGDQTLSAAIGDRMALELLGPEQVGADRELLSSIAEATGRLWHTQRLAEQARRAEELARIDELRSSLLAAVGHDLRNPLATITAAASTLQQTDITLPDADRNELLTTINEHAARLNDLIANLLDASRLQAGALSVLLGPTALLEVLGGVVQLGSDRLALDVPEQLPLLQADAGLLERVLANLVDNADRHQQPGRPVLLRARLDGRRVLIEVIDHGPGVPLERRSEIFAPFQHFSDRGHGGVGLGLAIARGFTEAMGGTLVASATPGGGLTMTVSLEVADAPATDR